MKSFFTLMPATVLCGLNTVFWFTVLPDSGAQAQRVAICMVLSAVAFVLVFYRYIKD